MPVNFDGPSRRWGDYVTNLDPIDNGSENTPERTFVHSDGKALRTVLTPAEEIENQSKNEGDFKVWDADEAKKPT